MSILSRFVAGQSLTPAESWIVVAVSLALVVAVALWFCALIDLIEDRRQLRRDREAVDAMLRNVEPVSEAASRALFEALMAGGYQATPKPDRYTGKVQVH